MVGERSILNTGSGGGVAPHGKGSRLILDSVNASLLSDIVGDVIDLLHTCAAVYEKSGDTALRVLSSGWCRFMDQASRRRCDTPDDRAAIESGRWHCHESCRGEAALRAIETNGPVDVACRGGIRIFAVPICAGEETVGSIGAAYGDPPRDPATLGQLATLYGVGVEELRRQADAHHTGSPVMLELAKKRILASARLIGEMVTRKQAEQTLRLREERIGTLFDLAKDTIFIYDQEGRILEANREACERLGYSRDEFLKMKPFEVDTPEEAALFPERIAILRRQGHHRFETVHQRRDGALIPVEVSVRLFESQGKLLYLSICRDITERKLAEKALRESEEKYRSILEQTTEWIWEIDTNGVHTFSNHAIAAILGYSLEEFMRLNTDSLLHGEDRAEVEARLPRLVAEKRGWREWILRWRHKDGSYRVLESNANPIIDSTGQLRGYRGVDRDITARKHAEAALRRSEEKFRSLVETTSDWVWEVDKTGAYTYASPRIRELLGYEPEEVLGKTPFDFMPPAEKERLARLFEAAARAKGPFNAVENTNIHKSGRAVSLETSAVPIIDGDGTLLGYRGIDRDITERKQAEAALIRSEALLSKSQALGHIGSWELDLIANRLTWSDEVYRIFGMHPREIVPSYEAFLAAVHPEDREMVNAAYTESVREGGVYEVEHRLVRRDSGEVRFVVEKCEHVKDAAGSIVRSVGMVQDITTRKRMEEEHRKLEVHMRQVQKFESLGILAGGIAHDFNNILMAILGNADLALHSLSPVSPARQFVEEITQASQRAADLCRQMLAYSGKGRFVVDRHDISEIVREMGQLIGVSISKKAMVRYSLAEGLPAVDSDATQIRQVIMNLIQNASDALGDGTGIITIATGVMECERTYLSESHLDEDLPGGTYVTLEVSDTGCGMDAETRSRIFDPFFTTKFIGRGLGLAAVLGIVRGHKGAVKVYSEPGRGTTMKILLPAVEREPDEPAKTAESGAPLKGGTILLVDDDPVVRNVASAMLAQLGFQVLTAVNGREGLNVFRAHGAEIACVLLDLTMPEMGGEDTFRELRNVKSDVRVILSSGYNEQEVTQRFVGKGLAGFIQKPYTTANLRSVLIGVLG